MKTIIRFTSGVGLLFAAIVLFSCNLEDFNMNKLADPVDIVPDVYAPLAYGTFNVKDLVTVPAPPDNTLLPAGGFPLIPLPVIKTGSSFSSAAIDSVYLITYITNNTPADIEFNLSFLSSAAGPATGKVFNSGTIPANSPEFRIPLFGLGPTDQSNLQSASYIKLDFKLIPPSPGPVTYGDVKAKSFTIKISFYAPVHLWKLTN